MRLIMRLTSATIATLAGQGVHAETDRIRVGPQYGLPNDVRGLVGMNVMPLVSRAPRIKTVADYGPEDRISGEDS